ncbi:hypothetical protein SAMN04487949_2463 [Halogranum gelatinilyticum]|uniref:DUF7128 domain-containing protein n=1 Tax=Halogranum gelatinilyticum TaxID=660521 RepID=A0A1G9VQP5_9EURY|nr:hypothetical protein [Halogranum gelatinilyticum]SDM74281.1 hypothetical protein SAMN04487949_2463 [Halogranum gelatinilyticum]
MVAATQVEQTTWYRCEKCGLVLATKLDAEQHEEWCAGDLPSYCW